MPPPPPPPPPPMMGGPPPPPPPPANLPSRPPAQNRVKPPATGALLSDISKGKQLKKTVTNDRSAPIVAKGNSGSAPSPLAGAPAVPGMSRPPGGLAPPVPGGTNRARSNSDQGGREASGASGIEQPPQLGGLFAGGMPKLKKRGGGVDTGANRDSSYTSDPESSSRTSAPKPPTMAAPRPPPTSAPPRPGISNAASAPTFHPSIANLRKAALNPGQRPMSSASMKGPPPPIGKKPPVPPPGGRKFSSQAPPPPPPSSMAPPPPPTSAPPLPGAPPPAAPRLPPSRSQAPPPPPPTSPPTTNGGGQSLAMQAAKRAAGQASPAAAPPPPPPSNGPSFRAPSPPSAAPPPPIVRAGSQQAPRSMYDPSSYTLSSNGNLPKNPSPSRDPEAPRRVVINDPRWKFQDESILPKPRDFIGGAKKYRAGRGSSVPLDLAAFQ